MGGAWSFRVAVRAARDIFLIETGSQPRNISDHPADDFLSRVVA